MEGSASPRASRCPRRDGGGGALLPFGEAPDGRLLRASAVPAGLACGCSCPGCGAPLVARRGRRRTAHFAHATGRTCASAHETVLHRLAKQLIADGAPLALPEVAAEHGGRRRLVRPATTIRPDAVALERGLDGLRPDILAAVAGRPLLVEVAVTHPCGPEKAALIRQRRLAAVEIDLSRVPRDATPDALERAVLCSAPRRWLWNRFAEAAEAEMRAEAARRAARLARFREEALGRIGRELAAAMAAAPSLRHPGGARLAWAVEAAREAGLGGAVGVALEGDGCFAVAREAWQSHLVARHVLGGVPLDGRAAAASLRPLLRGRFAEPKPGGFEWAALSARFPGLRPPSDVLADYARRLGFMGLLARGPDGLWRATRAAAKARDRRDALAVFQRCPAGQAACHTDPSEGRPGPARGEELPHWKAEGIPNRLDQPDPDQNGRTDVRLRSGARTRTSHHTA